jgi:hypothetical protein
VSKIANNPWRLRAWHKPGLKKAVEILRYQAARYGESGSAPKALTDSIAEFQRLYERRYNEPV